MKRTLVLNSGYEPLQLVSWKRAMVLLYASKAEMVSQYEDSIRSVSKEHPLPSVIKLNKYIRSARRFHFVTLSRRNILLRDGLRCQYCAIKCSPKVATIDHIIPKSRGGRTSWENLVTACPPCNRKKGNKYLRDVEMDLLRRPIRPHFLDIVKQLHDLPPQWEPFLQDQT